MTAEDRASALAQRHCSAAEVSDKRTRSVGDTDRPTDKKRKTGKRVSSLRLCQTASVLKSGRVEELQAERGRCTCDLFLRIDEDAAVE